MTHSLRRKVTIAEGGWGGGGVSDKTHTFLLLGMAKVRHRYKTIFLIWLTRIISGGSDFFLTLLISDFCSALKLLHFEFKLLKCQIPQT